MAAALLFGLTNHFVVSSPDHVDHVAAQWRPLFISTAIALAVTEAAGAILGFTQRKVTSSTIVQPASANPSPLVASRRRRVPT
jgi:hypothetical protein